MADDFRDFDWGAGSFTRFTSGPGQIGGTMVILDDGQIVDRRNEFLTGYAPEEVIEPIVPGLFDPTGTPTYGPTAPNLSVPDLTIPYIPGYTSGFTVGETSGIPDWDVYGGPPEPGAPVELGPNGYPIDPETGLEMIPTSTDPSTDWNDPDNDFGSEEAENFWDIFNAAVEAGDIVTGTDILPGADTGRGVDIFGGSNVFGGWFPTAEDVNNGNLEVSPPDAGEVFESIPDATQVLLDINNGIDPAKDPDAHDDYEDFLNDVYNDLAAGGDPSQYPQHILDAAGWEVGAVLSEPKEETAAWGIPDVQEEVFEAPLPEPPPPVGTDSDGNPVDGTLDDSADDPYFDPPAPLDDNGEWTWDADAGDYTWTPHGSGGDGSGGDGGSGGTDSDGNPVTNDGTGDSDAQGGSGGTPPPGTDTGGGGNQNGGGTDADDPTNQDPVDDDTTGLPPLGTPPNDDNDDSGDNDSPINDGDNNVPDPSDLGDLFTDPIGTLTNVVRDIGNTEIGDILEGGINFYGAQEAAEAYERSADKALGWQRELQEWQRPFWQTGVDHLPGLADATQRDLQRDPRENLRDLHPTSFARRTAIQQAGGDPEAFGGFQGLRDFEGKTGDWDYGQIERGSDEFNLLTEDAIRMAENQSKARGRLNSQEARDSAFRSYIRSIGDIESINQSRLQQEMGRRGFDRDTASGQRAQEAGEQLSTAQTRFENLTRNRERAFQELFAGEQATFDRTRLANEQQLQERQQYWQELLGEDEQEWQKYFNVGRLGQSAASGSATAATNAADILGAKGAMAADRSSVGYRTLADIFFPNNSQPA